MKKTGWLLVTFMCFVAVKTNAQSYWSKLYNFGPDTLMASGNSAQYTDDSFFIAGGQASIDSPNSLTAYLAVFDYRLNLLHKKYIRFAGLYNRFCGNDAIIKLDDDKYAMVGIEEDMHINSRISVMQPYFYFFDHNLDSIHYWKYLDTVQSRYPYSIIKDKQTNIVLAGAITSRSLYEESWLKEWYADSFYVWIAKYDSTGNELWSKALFGSTTVVVAQKIVLAHDSESYIITGLAINPAVGNVENFFAKIDTNGNVIWQKFLPRKFQFPADIDLTPMRSGGYAFVTTVNDSSELITYTGGTSELWPLGYYYYCGQIDEKGDTVWTKPLVFNDSVRIDTAFASGKKQDKLYYFSGTSYHKGIECEGRKIIQTDNGDLLMSGTSSSSMTWPSLVRTDSAGNEKWYRDIKYNNAFFLYQEIANISFTKSKQVLLTGIVSTNGGIPGLYDTLGDISWFVLTDTFGCMLPSCEMDTSWIHHDTTTNVSVINEISIEINIYPNPAQQQLFIQTSSIPNNSEAELMDISGRRLYRLKLKANTKEEIEVGNLEPGLYLLQVWVNGVMVKTYKVSKVE